MLKLPKYIYDLSYDERRKLCFLLDQNNKWEKLAKEYMGYSEMDIELIKKEAEKSHCPSIELLTMWGNQNHEVLELFYLLKSMKLYEEMAIIKGSVESKYHLLLKPDAGNNQTPLHDIKNTNKVLENKNGKNNDVRQPANEQRANHIQRNNNQNVIQQANGLNNLNKPNGNSQPQQKSNNWTVLVMASAGVTPTIPYGELEAAAGGWDPNRILGQGGFGTVFKGMWKFTHIAIKKLEVKENTSKDLAEQMRQSITELHCLNSYRHDNILPLYGFSLDGPHPCLVYQFMPGGSLDTRLRTKDLSRLLTWPSRLNIALGAARGLQFLHDHKQKGKPCVHGDIKSANILLDFMDQPRLGDFGLAREGPADNLTHMLLSRVQGTRPYLPQEFIRGRQYSIKVDTYSFGIVLFELVTALPAAANSMRWTLKNHILNCPEKNILQIKDSKVPGGESIVKEFVRIGKSCIHDSAKLRPIMKDVYQELERVFQNEISRTS